VPIAINEVKDQLDTTAKESMPTFATELHEIAVLGQAGSGTKHIREDINDTQQASQGLFRKL
jgi:hypothetical protein